jgi:predicted nuclease of predicted toxin-antitoxin system
MALKFKVDEDLPHEFGARLRSAGHDAMTVVEQSLSGSPDAKIWQIVQKEKRCLLTADKGFADVRMLSSGLHDGVILFRLPRESRLGYLRLLESLLTKPVLESIAGTIMTVSPDSIRVRR